MPKKSALQEFKSKAKILTYVLKHGWLDDDYIEFGTLLFKFLDIVYKSFIFTIIANEAYEMHRACCLWLAVYLRKYHWKGGLWRSFES